tara:strand:- start:160 stop:516 length:357 start_codon:yes stop_codon:yes gene_type:complete
MKKILLIVAAAAISSPVLAGPYVNLETKAKYTGSDYKSRGTDLHVGYENKINDLAWYIQGGQTLNSIDGGDSDSNWSGKTGAKLPVTDKLKVYGELSFSQVEGSDNSWGTKLGTKYSF